MDLTRAGPGTITQPTMDQFSAHLDRGWDLVQRGDPRGAELSARRALELDSQSPEAFNLLGYVCALKGEYEDSVWQHLAGTVSVPFEAGQHAQIAVKVIDDRGNELMVVKALEKAQ